MEKDECDQEINLSDDRMINIIPRSGPCGQRDVHVPAGEDDDDKDDDYDDNDDDDYDDDNDDDNTTIFTWDCSLQA